MQKKGKLGGGRANGRREGGGGEKRRKHIGEVGISIGIIKTSGLNLGFCILVVM